MKKWLAGIAAAIIAGVALFWITEGFHNIQIRQEYNEVAKLKEPVSHEPPAVNKTQPLVTRIREGRSDSKQRRMFDITIENPTPKQMTLDTWEIEWRYHPGALSSIAQAVIINPKTAHSIELHIDPSDIEVRKKSKPITPTIILPAGTDVSPSIFEFRLELLYAFDSLEMYHRASDWDIFFLVVIRTTTGKEIPIFLDQRWRD